MSGTEQQVEDPFARPVKVQKPAQTVDDEVHAARKAGNKTVVRPDDPKAHGFPDGDDVLPPELANVRTKQVKPKPGDSLWKMIADEHPDWDKSRVANAVDKTARINGLDKKGRSRHLIFVDEPLKVVVGDDTTPVPKKPGADDGDTPADAGEAADSRVHNGPLRADGSSTSIERNEKNDPVKIVDKGPGGQPVTVYERKGELWTVNGQAGFEPNIEVDDNNKVTVGYSENNKTEKFANGTVVETHPDRPQTITTKDGSRYTKRADGWTKEKAGATYDLPGVTVDENGNVSEAAQLGVGKGFSDGSRVVVVRNGSNKVTKVTDQPATGKADTYELKLNGQWTKNGQPLPADAKVEVDNKNNVTITDEKGNVTRKYFETGTVDQTKDGQRTIILPDKTRYTKNAGEGWTRSANGVESQVADVKLAENGAVTAEAAKLEPERRCSDGYAYRVMALDHSGQPTAVDVKVGTTTIHYRKHNDGLWYIDDDVINKSTKFEGAWTLDPYKNLQHVESSRVSVIEPDGRKVVTRNGQPDMVHDADQARAIKCDDDQIYMVLERNTDGGPEVVVENTSAGKVYYRKHLDGKWYRQEVNKPEERWDGVWYADRFKNLYKSHNGRTEIINLSGRKQTVQASTA